MICSQGMASSHILHHTSTCTRLTVPSPAQLTLKGTRNFMPLLENSGYLQTKPDRLNMHKPRAFAFGGVSNTARSLESQMDELESSSAAEVCPEPLHSPI